MNFFCRIWGHTWVPQFSGSDPRWNINKNGLTLDPIEIEGEARHYDTCARCGKEREANVRGDYDRPAVEPEVESV